MCSAGENRALQELNWVDDLVNSHSTAEGAINESG